MYRKYLLEPIPESSSKWNNSPLKICTSYSMVKASLQISLRLSILMLRLSSITQVRQIYSQKSIHGWENRPIFFNTDAKSKTCTYQLWNTISFWKKKLAKLSCFLLHPNHPWTFINGGCHILYHQTHRLRKLFRIDKWCL